MTIGELYKYSCNFLENIGICDKSEVHIIFKHILNLDLKNLILDKNKILSQDQINKILNILSLRKNKIPIQYILKKCEFMGLEFEVGPGVLIPRDDTSVLVNFVTNILKKSKNNNINIIDLCSGSGCIAITLEQKLKYFLTNINIYALEKSPDSYEYLVKNKQKHSSNINLIHGDVFKDSVKFPDNFFDCIVSNPPYIKTQDICNLQKEVLFEPKMALDGGTNGLKFYESICSFWQSKLKNNGLLAFEIGYNQYQDVKNILLKFNFCDIFFERDINNIIRVIAGFKK